ATWSLAALLISLAMQAALTWAALSRSSQAPISSESTGLQFSAFSALPALTLLLLAPLQMSLSSPSERMALGLLLVLGLSIAIPISFGVAVFAVLRNPRPNFGWIDFGARLSAPATLAL